MVPEARHIGISRIILAAVPLFVGIIWGAHHLAAVAVAVQGHGHPMAATWLFAFLLLWWLPLSWMERPFTARPDQQRALDALTVTVSVPVYNEPPERLRACLESLLGQTRLPNRVHVVDDGTTEYRYGAVADWFHRAATAAGVEALWTCTENRGKRHAQMEALAHDDADVYLTLDSDTILDRRANEEGLKAFADRRVHSVAGMVVVWNSHGNWLARLTCMLYTPFTRGFRSAQSVLGQVMVNSGTLAWYWGDTIRRYRDSYAHETFRGRPMQMNDDSLMTLYGLLAGRAVHQPSAVAYTIVPETFGEYRRQQMRWMRGTLVRSLWWFRYMPVASAAFWMPMLEYMQLVLAILLWPALLLNPQLMAHWRELALATVAVSLLVNYLTALRFFNLRRSDETLLFQLGIFLLAPIAGIWRTFVLRPMMIYSYCTFWRVGSWGTRGSAEEDEVVAQTQVIRPVDTQSLTVVS